MVPRTQKSKGKNQGSARYSGSHPVRALTTTTLDRQSLSVTHCQSLQEPHHAHASQPSRALQSPLCHSLPVWVLWLFMLLSLSALMGSICITKQKAFGIAQGACLSAKLLNYIKQYKNPFWKPKNMLWGFVTRKYYIRQSEMYLEIVNISHIYI